jgi:hypothetical protein
MFLMRKCHFWEKRDKEQTLSSVANPSMPPLSPSNLNYLHLSSASPLIYFIRISLINLHLFQMQPAAAGNSGAVVCELLTRSDATHTMAALKISHAPSRGRFFY